MARVVVLGAGISGHTAALYLKRRLGSSHEVVVVSPNSNYNWIPSNIWVGVGKMSISQVKFPLAPVYRRKHIDFRQAKAVAIWPEGDDADPRGAVDILYTAPGRSEQSERLRYDYLINATGPKLNFNATPGLGPDQNSWSVCTAEHAQQTAAALAEIIQALKSGERRTLVVGMGHGGCTCEGAAFEYAFNVEHELRENGVRQNADLIYLSNEFALGDFGVDGMKFSQNGYVTSSKLWTESLFRERNVKAILQAHVERVDPGVIHYEQLDGTRSSLEFDFAMLLPPFRGVDLLAYDKSGKDITSDLFAPNGFLRVDADYSAKPYEQWSADDWPKSYQSPLYDNLFGIGIAFAPPHPISKPRTSINGTIISPAPPRTGMPSGVMGRLVAENIARRIHSGSSEGAHTASMAHMGAACIASAGSGLRNGTAAAMTMYPIVPDYKSYPLSGRDDKETTGEIGLSGHWTKLMLHYLFIYKAKARPGWHLIPE
ncbi:MAG: NAD(P)/FAD-dependent oxidoreductase [Acidimicrobiaceae bacterium]|nr:NAD(P)/FAD-dependent oxidoreductase [Acidimicrobiaceae bacterium]